jgi:hypothetical protein
MKKETINYFKRIFSPFLKEEKECRSNTEPDSSLTIEENIEKLSELSTEELNQLEQKLVQKIKIIQELALKKCTSDKPKDLDQLKYPYTLKVNNVITERYSSEKEMENAFKKLTGEKFNLKETKQKNVSKKESKEIMENEVKDFLNESKRETQEFFNDSFKESKSLITEMNLTFPILNEIGCIRLILKERKEKKRISKIKFRILGNIFELQR